jgi:probable HAF family extracellular repeat protein
MCPTTFVVLAVGTLLAATPPAADATVHGRNGRTAYRVYFDDAQPTAPSSPSRRTDPAPVRRQSMWLPPGPAAGWCCFSRTRWIMRISIVCAAGLAALSTSLTSIAPGTAAATAPAAAPRYTIIDVGTFGGARAELNGPAVQLTDSGVLLGSADTTIPDTDYPAANPFGTVDPRILHAFKWRHGDLKDLGALPGNNPSYIFEVNRHGVGAGNSETGWFDSRNNYPAAHAVLFRHQRVRDLGTLPGGTESWALGISSRGEVAGFANNTVPDPYSMVGYTTQTRAFVWRNGTMTDLGTLGGPDAAVATVNERGEVAGDSYVNDRPNAVTGVPTSHPFVWADGHMRDLGTLGGTQSGTTWMNSRGEVVGTSNLSGNRTSHPYLWDRHRLRDLGTLGGPFGIAWHINDKGDVVGWSNPSGSDNIVHAFRWRHGTMSDLTGPSSSQCTYAEGINRRQEVVGGECGDAAALLWSHGKQYDLNTLIGPTSVHLTEASYINDRGEIASLGVLPNGDQHVFLLRPSRDRSTPAQKKEEPRRTATRSWRQCFTQSELRPQLMLGCLDMR